LSVLDFCLLKLKVFLCLGLNPFLPQFLSKSRYLRQRDGQRRERSAWNICYNNHPDQRLVSDEEAREIEEILAHNATVRGYGSTALKYPLSGLVFCGECRSACYSMKGSRGKNQPGYNYYFQCKNWRLRSCGQKKVIRMEVAEALVVNALLDRSEALAQIAANSTLEREQEPMELKELRSQLEGLEQLGYNPAFEQAKRELRSQIERFRHKLLEDSCTQNANRELLLQTFGERTYWLTLLEEEKSQIYRTLVDRVITRDGRVESVLLKV
jgi:hypothetical protein